MAKWKEERGIYTMRVGARTYLIEPRKMKKMTSAEFLKKVEAGEFEKEREQRMKDQDGYPTFYPESQYEIGSMLWYQEMGISYYPLSELKDALAWNEEEQRKEEEERVREVALQVLAEQEGTSHIALAGPLSKSVLIRVSPKLHQILKHRAVSKKTSVQRWVSNMILRELSQETGGKGKRRFYLADWMEFIS